MSINFFSSVSTLKQSGALISSRFIPPKEGPRSFTQLMNSSGSCVSTQISIDSTPANLLKSTAFPSITGFDASDPMFPRPRTAVPLEITATVFPLLVYLYAFSLSQAIAIHGTATPGEYARERSFTLFIGLVDLIVNFPGIGVLW